MTSLGAFAVAGSAADADAFRAATGLSTGGDVLPLIFPMRWLVLPAVRSAMTSLVPESDLVLVHESQSFDYEAPLRIDTAYTMHLTGRRKTEPDQLIVDGAILDADGATLGTLETVLRLFSARAEVA